MKKHSHQSILSSLIVLAFIVPQIAFAAWWNPISWFNGWSFFHRTDTKTQVLENRVKELGKQLANTATSTEASAPKKVTPVVVPAKAVTPAQTVVVPADSQLIMVEKCKIAAQMSIDEARDSVLATAELMTTNCINTSLAAIEDTVPPESRSLEIYNSISSMCHDRTQNYLNNLRTQLYNQKYLACLNGN